MTRKRGNGNVKGLSSLIVVILLFLSSSVPAVERDKKNRGEIDSVLDPRGIWPKIERIPLSPRLSSLKGKRIYIINSWASGTGFETIFSKIALRDEQEFPN
jgi:hypothetical protein